MQNCHILPPLAPGAMLCYDERMKRIFSLFISEVIA